MNFFFFLFVRRSKNVIACVVVYCVIYIYFLFPRLAAQDFRLSLQYAEKFCHRNFSPKPLSSLNTYPCQYAHILNYSSRSMSYNFFRYVRSIRLHRTNQRGVPFSIFEIRDQRFHRVYYTRGDGFAVKYSICTADKRKIVYDVLC